MKVYTENVLNLLFTFQNNRIDVELNRRHDYREQKYQNFLILIVPVLTRPSRLAQHESMSSLSLVPTRRLSAFILLSMLCV